MRLFLLSCTPMLFCPAIAFAQTTTSSHITTAIVSPINITKTTDLSFGNVAVSLNAGTVCLTPQGNRIPTGGATLPVVSGMPEPAAFEVTGEADYSYFITLPSALTLISGMNSMTINSFTSTPATTGLLATGSQMVKIGATLHVGASQFPDYYLSDTEFTVIVNYD